MYQSQEVPKRSPFTQANLSSSSLEGMERPIRSFKSFIRTVPPTPSPPRSDKPLPPTPSTSKGSPTKEISSEGTPSPTSSTSTRLSGARNASVVSWKAPADWFNGATDLARSHPGTPPISAGRHYSPLLPEPSPDMSERFMDLFPVQGSVGSPQPSRLNPIYERTNADLGPPRSPPRSPLPIPPKSNARSAPLPIPPITRNRYQEISRSPRLITAEGSDDNTTGMPHTDNATTQNHPLNIPLHRVQRTDMSTKEKAYASLGIEAQPDQAMTDGYRSSPNQRRPDRRYMRGRKLRSLNKGNPLSEDSWEDPDLDDKARQLSFSQDYHDLLVDQYQELSVLPEEVIRDSPKDFSLYTVDQLDVRRTSRHQPYDHDLVPGPLSWRKSSNSLPQSASLSTSDLQTINTDSSSVKKHRVSEKLSAWVPHRLSTGTKGSDHASTTANHHSRKDSKELHRTPFKKMLNIHGGEVEKDLRFYNFFPPSKPFRFKKVVKVDDGKNKQSQPSVLPPLAPKSSVSLGHFSGATTVVRAPSLRPRSEQASIVEASSGKERPNSATLPLSDINSELASSPTSTRYSQYSQHSNPNEFRGPMAQNETRGSTASSHTRVSSGSSHPLASEITQSTYSQSPLSFNSSWSHSGGDPDTSWHKPGFLSKAMAARRQRNRDLRQKELKDSIKILGPTDPYGITGPVRDGEAGDIRANRRMPGYMVSGSA